jgi:hypothetical protein
VEHPPEKVIEQYILKTPELDDDRRREIKQHLQSCTECSSIYNYINAFYTDYNVYTASSTQTSKRLETFLSVQYSVLPLKPLYSRDIYNSGHITVLAALTPTQDFGRFKTIVTLAAEREKTLVRIIRDSQTGAYKFYVLTENPVRKSHALLSFPEISTNFITDDRGQLEVDIDTVKNDDTWASLSGVLRLSVAEVELSADEITQNLISKKTKEELYYLSIRLYNETFSCTVVPHKAYAPPVSIAVLCCDRDQPRLMLLRNGTGQCTVTATTSVKTIRLYC